ncbi:GNAT family N-acetyltransferase [Chloroflexi bacterium TSY]|nr:GNAT family N-acetyltransferase [Chloroflexi bacterium TSY]
MEQSNESTTDELVFKPVALSEWDDLEILFSALPAPSMCWCMYWKKTRSEWWGQTETNKASLKASIESGMVPGILAYRRGQVAGWCSIAPRSEFPSLDRSHTLKRIDDEPVWSITCFVIGKQHRRTGVGTALVQEAISHAVRNGARIIEAYPLCNEGGKRRMEGESFMGFASTFERLGFKQVSNRSDVRNIMRLYVEAHAESRHDDA